MRLSSLAAFAILVLSNTDAHACTCMGVAEGHEAEWASSMVDYADTVVLARVISVGSDFPKSAVLEVSETLKGRPVKTRQVRESHCPTFYLKEGDVRVFFLLKEGVIAACSDYDYRISTNDLLPLLRKKRK
jgi:hypothetical protein